MRNHDNSLKPEKKQSTLRDVWKRLSKNRTAMFGMFLFFFLLLCAVFAPVLAPYSYEEIDPFNAYALPSAQHWFGCDKMGRDILSRLLYGARYSLGIGVCAQLFGACVGGLLGCVAGYCGGKVDNVIMRLMDLIQAIPSLLLAIVVSTALGSGFFNTVLALGVGGLSHSCRMLRAQFLTVRDKEYMEAARAIDCSVPRQIFIHILPNAISPLIVSTTMGVGSQIMTAASLSFIGLGIQPPLPEWGAMLTAAREVMRYYPHTILFPGLCIALTVLSLNMFGDGLRDALDPKLRN